MHGDYSPKNLLVAPGRLLVLDAEVAWFGDVAFLTHHLLLHANQPAACLALIGEAWTAYSAAVAPQADADLEQRTVTLTLCLMLARALSRPLGLPGDREHQVRDRAGRRRA